MVLMCVHQHAKARCKPITTSRHIIYPIHFAQISNYPRYGKTISHYNKVQDAHGSPPPDCQCGTHYPAVSNPKAQDRDRANQAPAPPLERICTELYTLFKDILHRTSILEWIWIF
eukprot:TRINITY_DN14171_c0_g1_i1.p2 TRINITY_DN14171_c0_g1~~TRINITY_DN14171_c0_g1_i1.p2  ORF type:complete len:115 (-),score=2.50 TRINITY_DN14171_c0_g1_i1:939-1283(-)